MKYLLNERLNARDAESYRRQMINALPGMDNDKVFETFEQVKFTATEFYDHWRETQNEIKNVTDNEIKDTDSKLTFVEILQNSEQIPKIRPKTRARTSKSVSSTVSSTSSTTLVHSKLRQKTRTSCNTITERLSNFHFPR